MKLEFKPAPRPQEIAEADWNNWNWQMRHSLKSETDYESTFQLAPSERGGFSGTGGDFSLFQVRTTPYYASLAFRAKHASLAGGEEYDPIRRILMPRKEELHRGTQAMLDPLGERRNNPAPRIIHRYPDRALFLVTDFCSVYCRYCTRKHFTGGERSFASASEYDQALSYLRGATGIREVILSGGDPLTLSDDRLDRILTDLRKIEHVEIIRIGTRMPVVCPMRVTEDLVHILRGAKQFGRTKPIFMMTHFNHPRELTEEAATAVERFVDNGIPVFNQMVLLNGVNNDAAIVQALSRRLLALRAKPYYMFQCDPSFGTDHLRTSIEESLSIQRELWGNISGLAMPNYSVDIPDGGGKTSLTPDFELRELRSGNVETGVVRVYEGWDGVRATYASPPLSQKIQPLDADLYRQEWDAIRLAKSAAGAPLAIHRELIDTQLPTL